MLLWVNHFIGYWFDHFVVMDFIVFYLIIYVIRFFYKKKQVKNKSMTSPVRWLTKLLFDFFESVKKEWIKKGTSGISQPL